MSIVKKSLEENKEEILKSLPKELHADLERAIEAAEDTVPVSEAEELQAIKTELTDNPDVDEAAAIAELEKNPTAHRPSPPPTQEEQDKEMQQRLNEVKAAAEN